MYLVDALVTVAEQRRDAWTLAADDVQLICQLSADGPIYHARIAGGERDNGGLPDTVNPREILGNNRVENALEFLNREGKRDVLVSDHWQVQSN